MKQYFQKIASVTLALLVFFSTMSFSVEKHYCGGYLMDVSFTGEVSDCGMNMETETLKKKSCCKDEVHHIEGQDELLTKSIEKIDFKNQLFITSYIVSYQALFETSEAKQEFYKYSKPPDIKQDYQVLYQNFLI